MSEANHIESFWLVTETGTLKIRSLSWCCGGKAGGVGLSPYDFFPVAFFERSKAVLGCKTGSGRREPSDIIVFKIPKSTRS